MDGSQYCRTCLSAQNLYLIFPLTEHHEKYSEVIFNTTGMKIQMNDNLSQMMCAPCIDFVNQCYRFRKKCQQTEKTLRQQLELKPFDGIKNEPTYFLINLNTFIDITDLLMDTDFGDYDDNITLSEYSVLEKTKQLETVENNDENQQNVENSVSLTTEDNTDQTVQIDVPKLRKDRSNSIDGETKTIEENEEGERRTEDSERLQRKIQCELCNKVLKNKHSLRVHNKIHAGYDVVCEHCGKMFFSQPRLLSHCKAKHGYEKTDKCSYCDYMGTNAEQVKIHERLHTGEKPFVCSQCGARFHRSSSHRTHEATHLPDKTVQCTQCPALFKSKTLMRIHRCSRHSTPRYKYSCGVCNNTFARRRNVVRHLMRIHSIKGAPEHVQRVKIDI